MNFWKIVLIIYIIFAVLNFGMNVMVAVCVKDKLRREYADYKAHNTLSFGARMCSLFRALLASACPIINALVTIFILFNFDRMVDKTLDDALDSWLELTPKDEVTE